MKLNAVTSLALLTAFGTIFFYAPEEATQGMVQKIFYVHVACAITMYIGFFLAFLGGLFYLLEKKLHWDELVVSAAEVGFFFCTVVLLTGPIWAKPIWGTWWDWDPRLTTTLLLWLLYAAYMVLRGYFEGSARGRAVTSIVAIIAFLDVPIIHFSVRLWRGIHPSVMASQNSGLTPKMQATLAITFCAMVLLFSSLMVARFRLERNRNLLASARLQHSENV
ncbi:MAG TPA: cytochrome c biogenesis protein CcsA [Bdellovibrionota bacterium]|nr:cytochrome c biogenesis protein CcsA [Bdellovibrionota bacterium]